MTVKSAKFYEKDRSNYISLSLLGVISMAQKNEIQQQYVKYVTEAPDGIQ